MAYRTVTGTINRIKDNSPWANARVNFILTSFGFNSTDDVIYPQSRTIAVTNASGEFSVSLWVSEASVSEAIYKVIFPSKESHEFFIPAGAGSINIATLLEFYSPANLPVQPSSFLTYVEGLIDAHIDDKANPHETTLEKARAQGSLLDGEFSVGIPASTPTAPAENDRIVVWASDTNGQKQLNILDDNNVPYRILRDSLIPVFADGPAGSFWPPTGPLALSAVDGGVIEVSTSSQARADTASKMPAIGLIMKSGFVASENHYMLLSKGDTGAYSVDLSAFADGDTLYIAPTGGFTNVRPSHPNLVQEVGFKIANNRAYVDFTKGIQGDHNGTTATTFAFGAATASSQVLAKTATAQRTATFPDKSGTVAMTDDVAAKADISDGVDANFAVETGNIIVAGAGTAAANGTYEPDGTAGGKARFTKTGGTTGDDSIFWDSIEWGMYSGGTFLYFSIDDVASPDLVTTWQAAAGAAPVPTVTAELEVDVTTIGKAIANAADADAVKSLLSIGSIIQSAAVYVSQEGDDLNAGTSIDLPVLTIGEAITKAEALIVAGADGVNIDVMDGGTYTGDIEIPATVHIEAPAATFIGTVAIDANASLTIDKHFAAANNDKMVEHSGGSLGAALYRANIQDGRGVAGTLTGVDNVRNVGGGGKNLFVDVGIMYVTTDGIGVGDVSSGDAGHIHIEIPDLYLAGNNAIGILGSSQGAGSSNIIGSIDHIIAIGSPTATVGISMTAAGASVKLTASEIVADTAYNISNGSLYLACPKITGATVGTPVNRLVGTADLNVYRGQFHFSTPAATTIAVAGTFVKAAGTTTSDALVGMTHADNRLTNTSGETRRFLVQASISITDGTGSKLVNLRLAKDGATIAATQVDANTGAHDLATVSAAWMIELAQTEYVEIWIANETDTANLTVTHGTLTAYSIDS